jgi:trimethylamine-N-oxide reductase cytochrome c-type subunit TorC
MGLLKALCGKEKFTGKHLLTIGAFLVFMLIFTGWSISYTSSNSFCGESCHIMDTYKKSWSSSAHKNVDCIACHSEPGISGAVGAKLNGLNHLMSNTFKSNQKPKAAETNINCLNCHQGKVVTNIEQGALRRSPHIATHYENGMNCLSCHAGIAHDIRVNTIVPTRDSCSRCHLDQMSFERR